MNRRRFLQLASCWPLAGFAHPAEQVVIPQAQLEDKIRGGFIGQVIGDLNGLKHEMKYIADPAMSRHTRRHFQTAGGPMMTRMSSGFTSSRCSRVERS